MAQTKNGYIPPSVQRQMDQHMQRMPANLQKYQSGNTYIPAHAAKEMASYMQKTMPAHMQEYITPYMHQQTTAGLNSINPGTSRVAVERAPAPNLMRRDHAAFGEQFNINLETPANPESSKGLSFSPQYSSQPSAPSPAPPPAPMPPANQNPYDFFTKEQPPKSKGFSLGGGSQKKRILLVTVGGAILLTLLLVVFSVISSSGKSGTQNLINLAEEQTEIIRVADIGVSKARTSDAQNLATVTSLSFRSTQTDTIKLLAKQGHKLKTKQLALKQNSNTDSQLTSASLNNNFDTTFVNLLSSSLLSYQKDVKQAYDSSKSKSEKAILSTSYNGVTLLLSDQTAQSN